MILVTLGTQDKPFSRLLEAVQRAVDQGALKDRIVVQAGYTKFSSRDMEVFDYIEEEKFAAFLKQADLIITHGGVGTIMTGLREHKKILAAARLAQYKEHHNDHQTQLLEAFARDGYLIYMKDLSDIRPYLKQAETFVPRDYVPNRDYMVQLIRDFIEKTGG
jgi:UDP-N-acetylglucosamine transferase subunit ALG13